MSVKERVRGLVEELSESDLFVLERMMRGLKLPAPATPVSEDERRARVDAVWGKYAWIHTSVDDFLTRKRADKLREDERDRRRQAGVP